MNKVLIWMIHLGRIRWIDKWDIKNVLEHAQKDLQNLELAWFEYACIINENDVPYTITITPNEKNNFLLVAKELSKTSKIKLWICVLYNDRKATLEIAKEIDANFVRIDTFVDLVKSDAWVLKPEAEKIIEYKRKLWLKDLKIFTDIQPKYKEMLENKTLLESWEQAIKNWSDWIIITGTKSWDPVILEDLKLLRKCLNSKILLWSWIAKENIKNYWEYIDWAFIWTSLKNWDRIEKEKAKTFIDYCNQLWKESPLSKIV